MTPRAVRITDEAPPRISVIDLAAAITQKLANQAAEQVAYLKKRHPEATEIFGDFKFPGQGQKKTPVAVAGTMAAYSGDDIPAQLAALLGRGRVRIRKTNESPPRISIIDVVIAVTRKTHCDAAQDFRFLLIQYTEVGTNCSNLRGPKSPQVPEGPTLSRAT